MRKVTGKKKEAQNGEDEGIDATEQEEGVENGDADADPLSGPAENDDDDEADADEAKEADEQNGDGANDDSEDEPLAKGKKTGAKKAKKAAKKAASKGRPKKKVSLNVPEEENDDDEDEEYEVADIIDHKYVGKKLLYRIRWKGFSAADDTWEPKDSLSCPDIIKRYEADNDVSQKAAAGASKGKKRAAPKAAKKPGKKAKAEEEEDDDEDGDDEKEYEVQRILDVTVKKNGKREFLVHWKGWSSRFDTWEPEENLNCDELIKAFDQKLDKIKASSQKELRLAPKTTKRFVAANNRAGGTRHSKRGGGKQRITYFEDE